MQANPFNFATPLGTPDDLVGRSEELARLLELATSGTYVMLEAPRRFGKTSLIMACTARWREAGGLAVSVDCSRVLTAPELAFRLERALEAADAGSRLDVGELLRAIRLKAGPVEVGLPPSASAGVDPSARLHDLLEVAADVAGRRRQRSFVCFDEFQDLLAVPGLDGVIRSHVQHHGDVVSYVFCGSEPSLLRALFTERSRPLYAQAKPFRLGRIALAPLAAHIADRFAGAGIDAAPGAERLVATAAGHPQRTMLLAWHLWDRASGDAALGIEDADAALDAALDDARPELEAIWTGLAGNERRVAVALAAALPPFGRAAREATGIASGSAAQRALAGLVQRGFVEREKGTATLTDPLLAIWLAREHRTSGPARRGAPAGA